MIITIMTTPAIAIPCLMGSAPWPSAPPAAAVVVTAVVVVDDEPELIEIEPEVAIPAPLPNPGISLRSVEQKITEEVDDLAF